MNRELYLSDGKKMYERPLLSTISLRPEEAVLGHCKAAGIGGGMFTTCQFVGGCPNQGS
jgi:hypothetical protein